MAMNSPVTQVPGDSIAMTKPVTHLSRDGNWLVQLTMPASLTLDTLTKARDPSIRFVNLPSNRQVVRRFSGIATAATLTAKEGELRSWARGQGLEVTAGPLYYFYDPPWILPRNRRNEVAFALK